MWLTKKLLPNGQLTKHPRALAAVKLATVKLATE